jgi:hypothetical protein
MQTAVYPKTLSLKAKRGKNTLFGFERRQKEPQVESLSADWKHKRNGLVFEQIKFFAFVQFGQFGRRRVREPADRAGGQTLLFFALTKSSRQLLRRQNYNFRILLTIMANFWESF